MSDAQTYLLIGAAMKVHSDLGPGFLERVYQEALAIELERQGVPHQTEVQVPIWYDGVLLQTMYRADVVAWGEVIVELKAIAHMGPIQMAQVLHYLKATKMERGLLLNFGQPRLEYQRIVNGHLDHGHGAAP